MDRYERPGYGRDAPPPSRRSPPGYQYYQGRERELDSYGPPHMEGRDLLSAGRERELDPYGPPRMEGRDLLSAGRDHQLDPYGPAQTDRRDLLSSGREHDLDSYRTRMEGRDLLSSGREHDLHSYRPRIDGRDLISSVRDHELDSYRSLRTEGRALLPSERHYDDRDHDRDIPALSAGWRERDPLAGGRDLFRDKTINGTSGMHPNDFGGTISGVGFKRVASDSFDDTSLIGSGSRFDRDMGSLQEPLGRDEHGWDVAPTGGGADSAREPVLFIDGLPLDCTSREAAHIFRPFIGYKEVRIVHKEPKKPGGEKTLLCFVEFNDLRHAAIAREALQGYKFDEQDPNSRTLRISFSLYSSRKGSHHEEPRGGRYPNRGYRA